MSVSPRHAIDRRALAGLTANGHGRHAEMSASESFRLYKQRDFTVHLLTFDFLVDI